MHGQLAYINRNSWLGNDYKIPCIWTFKKNTNIKRCYYTSIKNVVLIVSSPTNVFELLIPGFPVFHTGTTKRSMSLSVFFSSNFTNVQVLEMRIKMHKSTTYIQCWSTTIRNSQHDIGQVELWAVHPEAWSRGSTSQQSEYYDQ